MLLLIIFMTIFVAIILGIIEGLTEFLPISSTFHLIWASKLLNQHIFDEDFVSLFEVFIQAGAILAVLLEFITQAKQNIQILYKVLVSFLPTAIVGFVLYKLIKGFFFGNLALQLGVFVAVGIIFILIESTWISSKLELTKNLEDITYKQAFLIGLIQTLAVIPGISRAGSVIVGMMFLGVNRKDAAKYSFLLAVPTILSAAAFDLYKMRDSISASSDNVMFLIIGSITAFISALFVVRWFIKFLEKNSLMIFGVYRILFAVCVALATVFLYK